MPLLRGTRPLKRWRYVALFCEELMACAAVVQVGPARQTFWAVLLRDSDPRLLERTRLLPRRGTVALTPGRLWVHDAGAGESGVRAPELTPHGPRPRAGAQSVALDFVLEEEPGIEALCPHGGAYVWTRKQAGVAAHGTVAIGDAPPRALEALAVIDDTAGYHARVTEWHWAAGVGVDPDGAPLAFNLVAGVNDPPSGSERAVWVASQAREAPPVRFAAALDSIVADDGSELRFAAEAQRSRRDNLLLVRSEYSAPFGTFSGMLPGGIPLARGLGVVEHHRARW
jgi:Protein of unknown function (DUF2804)